MKKSKGRKDFEKKRNIRANNWTVTQRKMTPHLRAGDGILTVSKKYKQPKINKDADNSTEA